MKIEDIVLTAVAVGLVWFVILPLARQAAASGRNGLKYVLWMAAIAIISSAGIRLVIDQAYVLAKQGGKQSVMVEDVMSSFALDPSAVGVTGGGFLLYDPSTGKFFTRGTQPTAVQQPASQPQTGQPAVDQPSAAPDPTLYELLPPGERESCWVQQMRIPLQSATTGGSTVIPQGYTCSLRSQKGAGFLSKNRYFFSCSNLFSGEWEVTKSLGEELEAITGVGTEFYGSGGWPPACVIEVASPTPAPVMPPPPQPSGCTPGLAVPVGTPLQSLGPNGPMAGGIATEATILTGGFVGSADNPLCQTQAGTWVWVRDFWP
jgi:hypothetical protein